MPQQPNRITTIGESREELLGLRRNVGICPIVRIALAKGWLGVCTVATTRHFTLWPKLDLGIQIYGHKWHIKVLLSIRMYCTSSSRNKESVC